MVPHKARMTETRRGRVAEFPRSPARLFFMAHAAIVGLLTNCGLTYPRGNPSPRVAMLFRWTSDVPPAIVKGIVDHNRWVK